MHCSAKAAIPEFFRFNRSLKGYLSINISESLSSASIPDTGGMPYTYTIRNIVCTGENLPALRREPYVWCLNDYRSILCSNSNFRRLPSPCSPSRATRPRGPT